MTTTEGRIIDTVFLQHKLQRQHQWSLIDLQMAYVRRAEPLSIITPLLQKAMRKFNTTNYISDTLRNFRHHLHTDCECLCNKVTLS